jgi:hypothetical protein
MNRYQDDQGQHDREFHTHRSERYRHPEHDSGQRFENYGSSARGSYGDESNQGRRGSQGNEMGGSRRYTDINLTPYDRFEQSRNYGSMGSYGGAQGFGDTRGGHHDSGHPFDSGTGSQRRYSDEGRGSMGSRGYREEGRGYGKGRSHDSSSEDLYGHDTSRRFQGSDRQSSYDFERDDYYSSNYGDDQGNYMGSGYQRETESRYGSGDYGSSGFIDQDRQSGQSQRKPREFNTARNRWYTDW